MKITSWILIAAAMVFLSTSMPSMANQPILIGDEFHSSMLGGGSPSDQNCTAQDSESAEKNEGLLSEIDTYLRQIVDVAMSKLFLAITLDGRFQDAVAAAMTLYIIIFGIAFMLGMVQLTLGQVLLRIFKLSIVIAIISPFDGWEIKSMIIDFFRGGGDDLIRFTLLQTQGVGLSGLVAYIPGQSVFAGLDQVAQQIIKPETIAKFLAALTTGPYGLAMGGLMLISTIAFIKLLVDALKTYAVSYVVRALLLGLAPIFFVFLLFEKTKQIFMTWLNFIINFTLQPVLLFVMLAFMMDLIDQASKDMLSTEVCWAEFQSTEGSANKGMFWRFADNGTVDPSEYDWEGQVNCHVGGGADCKPFPIDIVDILSFVFLIFLTTRFAAVIPQLCNTLTNAFISLDQGHKMEDLFKSANKAGGNAVAGALTPAVRTP